MKFWIIALEGGVASAMVAVQMCIEQQVQRPLLQAGADQLIGLFRMRAVAAVNECAEIRSEEQNVVRGQPAALENMHALRQFDVSHWMNSEDGQNAAGNALFGIFLTIVLDKSSRYSMYLGCLQPGDVVCSTRCQRLRWGAGSLLTKKTVIASLRLASPMPMAALPTMGNILKLEPIAPFS